MRSLSVSQDITSLTPSTWTSRIRGFFKWSWYSSSNAQAENDIDACGNPTAHVGGKLRSRFFAFRSCHRGIDGLPSRRGGSIATAPIPDVELARAFKEETARQVALLTSEQQAALAQVRELLFGKAIAPERIQAADQLVVCGDRDAMLLSFLSRKSFDVKEAYACFERIITWRVENDIDNILHESKLPREKVQKHRKCWPTGFYPRDKEGDPILVDRMGILHLTRLKSGPVALDLNDMITYYIQTMEGRRRLLFPHLSRESGRLVTKYTSVCDVSSFGPQHFGPSAVHFMRAMGEVFADNYDDAIKKLYIINAPFWFHKIWSLISKMMSPEALARVQILSKRDSMIELSKVFPEVVAEAIVNGHLEQERVEEEGLHEFLDLAAKETLDQQMTWTTTTAA